MCLHDSAIILKYSLLDSWYLSEAWQDLYFIPSDSFGSRAFKLLPRVSVGLSLGGQGGALILTSLWTHQLTSLPVAKYNNVCSSMFGVLQKFYSNQNVAMTRCRSFPWECQADFSRGASHGRAANRVCLICCGIVFIIPWSLVKDIKRHKKTTIDQWWPMMTNDHRQERCQT